jgi:type IV pilus assembly protein PilA
VQRKARGFTIIELMLAVTVVAILITIALPAFQAYSIRGKVSEAFSLASAPKTRLSEMFQQQGSFPADNAAADLAEPDDFKGKFVGTIEVLPEGVIRVTFSDRALVGRTVTFTANTTGRAIIWDCTSALPPNYLPASCR